MTSSTYNPSIDQAAKLNFMDSFHELAQQSKSKLVGSGVITFMAEDGKTNNLARIGRLELSEVDTRNPDKSFGDYALDNRQFTKRRFTKTIQIDKKYDVNELLKDPTSDILRQLVNAKERVIDRIAVAAALGNVLVGAPDATPSSISAATDGVLTVDATSGLTYAKIQEITENFINNDLQYEDFRGSLIGISGTENTDLMGEEEFISSDFINGRPVEAGVQMQAGTYGIAMFAGSKNGGVQVVNPILPEASTTRKCVVLAPNSIAMAMKVADIRVEQSALKVNSWDLTIDFWINAMRTEGARVQQVNTTI